MQKAEILLNAVQLTNSSGIIKPKVVVLAAVESEATMYYYSLPGPNSANKYIYSKDVYRALAVLIAYYQLVSAVSDHAFG